MPRGSVVGSTMRLCCITWWAAAALLWGELDGLGAQEGPEAQGRSAAGGRRSLRADEFSLSDLEKDMQAKNPKGDGGGSWKASFWAMDLLFSGEVPVPDAVKVMYQKPTPAPVARPSRVTGGGLFQRPRAKVRQVKKRCGGQECLPGQVCVPSPGGVSKECGCPVMYAWSTGVCDNPNFTSPEFAQHPECQMPLLDPRFKEKIRERAGGKAIAMEDKHTLHLHRTHDLPTRANFDSCAVVGSAASLGNSGLGREIDSHTAVIRFNNAPTKGFQRDVGRKTTLRIQNMDYCGWAESPRELCYSYTKQETCSGEGALVQGAPSKCNPNTNMLTAMYWAMNRPEGIRDAACTGANHDKCSTKTSAGWFGILLAMNICGRVDVYGFSDPFKRAGGSTGHYFKKRGDVSTRAWAVRHHWQFEKHCLQVIAEGHVPGVAMHYGTLAEGSRAARRAARSREGDAGGRGGWAGGEGR